jgi:hypothetical protein
MGWIFGAVVFLTVVYFLARSPELRKLALGIVSLVVLWLAVTYFTDQDRQRREASAINPAQVELSNLSLRNSYGSWELTGLVTNNSPYALRSISFNVFVQNCTAYDDSGAPSDCHVVGQFRVNDYVSVPSGQQRSLSAYVSLYDLPQLSNWTWDYSDVQTTADLSGR